MLPRNTTSARGGAVPVILDEVTGRDGFFAAMPAYAGALGAKLVTFYPGNRGIPTHHALILLFRPETGEPLAAMDGRLITEMRTAAVSAVATQLLARPDAETLAISARACRREVISRRSAWSGLSRT
jgi:ornithine cyclodeaminase/alanine dehydrogenase-like protein (mu-crystallin family)